MCRSMLSFERPALLALPMGGRCNKCLPQELPEVVIP